MPDSTPANSVRTGLASVASSAMRAYRRLLASADTHSVEQREHLIQTAAVLGKKPEDVEADHATVVKAIRLRSIANTVPNMEQESAQRKEEADKAEYHGRQKISAIEQQIADAKSRAASAENNAIAARDAAGELDRLKDSARELLAEI